MRLIAQNDYQTFLDDQDNFKKEFNATYKGCKKGGNNILTLQYMIMFGAYNLFEVFGSLDLQINDEQTIYFKYLIETKPLDVVLRVLFATNHFKFTPGALEFVRQTLISRHPDMPNFTKDSVLLFHG